MEKNESSKRELEKEAERAANGWSDIAAALALDSAVLTAAAAVMAAVPGIGPLAAAVTAGVAAALAASSATAWAQSNQYAAMVIDPPRQDFKLVSDGAARFRGSYAQERRRSSSPSVWHEFAGHALLMSWSMSDLITSLERHAGALKRRDQTSAGLQLEAVRQNAEACALTHESILALTPALNLAWVDQDVAVRRATKEAKIRLPQPTLKEAHSVYSQTWRPALYSQLMADGWPLQDMPMELFQFFETSPNLLRHKKDKHPNRAPLLFVDRTCQSLAITASTLRRLVVVSNKG